jgi:hypothetical protein
VDTVRACDGMRKEQSVVVSYAEWFRPTPQQLPAGWYGAWSTVEERSLDALQDGMEAER